MRAFVAGSTGNVGAAVVGHLAARGHEVRALSRRPPGELPEGVEAVVGDLDAPEGFASSLAGTEALFMYAGHAGQRALLAAAADAGVRRVVLLSSGSVGASTVRTVVTAYHEEAEREVRDSGLGWTFLRPHTFMSNSLSWRGDLASSDTVTLRFATVPSSVVDPDEVGEVAAVCLAEPDHVGAVHRCTGPEVLTPADQVAALGTALGRDLRVHGLTDEEAEQELRASMPAAYAEAFVEFFVRGALDEGAVHPGVPDVLGRPARSWSAWVDRHRAEFT